MVNPGGHPKGPRLSTILCKFLEKEKLPNLSDPKLTEAEKIVLAWIFKMKNGGDVARQQALDRLEGPLAQINFNANTQLSGQGYEALCDAYFKAKQRNACPPSLPES